MSPSRAFALVTFAALGAACGCALGAAVLPGAAPTALTAPAMKPPAPASPSPSVTPSATEAPSPGEEDLSDYAAAVDAAEDALDEAGTSLDEADGQVADGGTLESLEQAITLVEVTLDDDPAEAAGSLLTEAYSAATEELTAATRTLTTDARAAEGSHDEWLAARASGAAEQQPAQADLSVDAGTDADSAFCTGLSDARESNGLPRFVDCVSTGQQATHAAEMAAAGDIWHTDGGESIVGYAVNVPQVMDAFMGSPPHRALILGRDYSRAEVGCAWRDGSLDEWGFAYLFCSAKFQ